MEYYTTTDSGRVRKNNEDYHFSISNETYSLFVVCDGMGGHNAGEVASEMATTIISNHIQENLPKSKDDIFDLIADSVRKAHYEIYEKSKTDSKYDNMGTTMILCLLQDNILYYANVGDSRIYIYSNDKLKQISKDHSYIQELIDAGAITEEEAKFRPKNRITSALGTGLEYKMDLEKMEISSGQYLLMTTDGLTDMIDDSDIEDVLSNEYNVRETCEILQYMANSTGGKDNITITLVRI